MRILDAARVSLCLASRASALAAFLVASLAARFWASTDRVEVAAARASVKCAISICIHAT